MTNAREETVPRVVEATSAHPSVLSPQSSVLVPELALSEAWHEQRFEGALRTVDGQGVSVVHRGTWTRGFGPDFRDAMLLFDGRELRAGSVEVHVRTSSWSAHGHHLDPRYDDVLV